MLRWFTAVVVIILLCAANAVGADVIIVRTSDAEPYVQADAALREKLEKNNCTVRSALAKEVAQAGVANGIGKADVVVAVGTASAKWLHEQLPATTSLAYCMVGNASDAGLTQGHPASGVTTDVSLADQFTIISQALPRAQVVGLLYHSDTSEGKAQLASLAAALPRGWRVEAVAVNEHSSIAEAIDALTGKSVDVIWTVADQKLYDSAAVRALLLAAIRVKTPVWGFSPAFVRAGALLGVGVEPKAQGSQAADVVLRMLSDPKSPAKVEPPRDYQIAVNLIVAQQLGIDLPESLTNRATFVYRPEK